MPLLIAVGVFLIIFGFCVLRWPQVAWRIENLFNVRKGEPTGFAVARIRVTGIVVMLVGIGITVAAAVEFFPG